jgi:hypothetical protein
MTWIKCNDEPDDKVPMHSGNYWVVIGGDSEYEDGHICLYDFPAYVILMYIESEFDGKGNPQFIRGTGNHDEDWDLVIAWWDEPVKIPEWK